MREQKGPAIKVPSSKTLIPFKGPKPDDVELWGVEDVEVMAMFFEKKDENKLANASIQHGARQGASIDIFQLAANGHATR